MFSFPSANLVNPLLLLFGSQQQVLEGTSGVDELSDAEISSSDSESSFLSPHTKEHWLKLRQQIWDVNFVSPPPPSLASLYCCSLCDSSFDTRASLRRHLRHHRSLVPSNVLVEKVNKPHRIFGTSNTQESYVEGQSVWRCSQCSMSFSTRSNMQRHQRHKHSAPGCNTRTHVCKDCKKSFYQKTDLTRHQEKVHQRQIASVLTAKNSMHQN